MISSLGGLCPKKFRSLDGLFAFINAGLNCADVGEGGSNAFSGSRTPSPLRILIELARFVFLVVDMEEGLLLRSSSFCILRTVRPCSRVGWSGARQMERSSVSDKGCPVKLLV